MNKKFRLNTLLRPKSLNLQGEGGLHTQGCYKISTPDKLLITVITVVFNGKKYLEKTIKSVINQTYDNVEYIIIDGGSSDGTLDIIYNNEHVLDYWVSEKDKGIYDAMNKAINLSTGEYIYHLGADDYLIDNTVITSLAEVAQKDDKDKIIAGYICHESGVYRSSISSDIFFKNTLHHQSAIYPKRLLLEFGLYNLHFKILSDFLMNQNIFLKYGVKKFKFINKPICFCRSSGVSKISKVQIRMERFRLIVSWKMYMKDKLNIK